MKLSHRDSFVLCCVTIGILSGCSSEPEVKQQPTKLEPPPLQMEDVKAALEPSMQELRTSIADLTLQIQENANRMAQLQAEFGDKNLTLQPHELLPPEVETLYAPEHSWEKEMQSEMAQLQTIAAIARDYVQLVDQLRQSIEPMHILAGRYTQAKAPLKLAEGHLDQADGQRERISLETETEEPAVFNHDHLRLLGISGDGVHVLVNDQSYQIQLGQTLRLPTGELILNESFDSAAEFTYDGRDITLQL